MYSVHYIMFSFYSMNEEDMRVMLASISPLTTSVNAVTWQDYIGTQLIMIARILREG